jgi:hypothetical protein
LVSSSSLSFEEQSRLIKYLKILDPESNPVNIRWLLINTEFSGLGVHHCLPLLAGESSLGTPGPLL